MQLRSVLMTTNHFKSLNLDRTVQNNISAQYPFLIALVDSNCRPTGSDRSDSWCLRQIIHIHWTDFVSNEEVRSRTGQPFLSDTIRSRRLTFFGHLSRADPSQDHSRALQSCIPGPPRHWRRRIGRPRQYWLHEDSG